MSCAARSLYFVQRLALKVPGILMMPALPIMFSGVAEMLHSAMA